jgi:hypothetical protein
MKRRVKQTSAGKRTGGARFHQESATPTDARDESETISSSPKDSKPSGAPTSGSKKSWQTPVDANDFARQTNKVATMLLNDEIDLEKARAYASLSRVVATTLSVVVTRSRFLKTEPDLSLGDEDGRVD